MTSMKMMAASHKIILLIFLTTFMCCEGQPPCYISHVCSHNKTFAANSTYQRDRTNLLSSLASQSAYIDFHNDTIVSAGGDTIYGLFMCRSNVSVVMCNQCVVNATRRLPSECQFSKEAIIWYNECMLRYSNRSIFSTLDTSPSIILLDKVYVTVRKGSFERALYDVTNKTAELAAKPAVGRKKYATGREKFSKVRTLYCLTQCTPDLSPQDCRRCLSGVIGELERRSRDTNGGRILYPSCNLRYELYPFYELDAQAEATPPELSPPTNSSAATPTQPALSPPTNSPKAATPTSLALSPPTNSLDPKVKGKSQSTRTIAIAVVSSVAGLGIFSCIAHYLFQSLLNKRRDAVLRQKYFGNESNNLEPLHFSLTTIEAATSKFSHKNCLGRGGFGQVYKGIFPNGQEIAVKRLSKNSGQGIEEFKNEVLLIAKLQHRNLVALLGFCIEEQEKILIYEYVQNKSLDYFLFGSEKAKVLNWAQRFKIIGGVARGIIYLHEYSRLKIIHRDLKPSNILLDDEMNPRISDFGLAKLVAINTNEGSTNRIVGTYGYMSPEYAMYGQYSEKSDVFSFGVIVLEIISGKKNTDFHSQSQYVDGLLSYAWKRWKEEKLLEILDSNIEEFGSYNEVIKCIQIGLLCVQENQDIRPTMAEVVSYLRRDSIQLPLPQEPAFFPRAGMDPSTSGRNESYSTVEVSISEFFPR